jgi:hypothetical protein
MRVHVPDDHTFIQECIMKDGAHTGFDIDGYERGISSRLDADIAMLTAQGNQFQQQFNAMIAAWQPIPPQMFAQYAQGLEQWIYYLGQAAGPAADWLAGAGRPAVRQRLNAVISDLVRAVPRYRQMAAQQAAHLGMLNQHAAHLGGFPQPSAYPSVPAQPAAHAGGPAQPAAHPAGPAQPAAHSAGPAQPAAQPGGLTQAIVQSNREIAAVWAATNAERLASYDRMSAARRSVL